jgi:hypothetical protein
LGSQPPQVLKNPKLVSKLELLGFDASFNVSGILMIHFSKSKKSKKSKLQRGITNFVWQRRRNRHGNAGITIHCKIC